MVILITGASHTGKTLLAQRLLEKYSFIEQLQDTAVGNAFMRSVTKSGLDGPILLMQ